MTVAPAPEIPDQDLDLVHARARRRARRQAGADRRPERPHDHLRGARRGDEALAARWRRGESARATSSRSTCRTSPSTRCSSTASIRAGATSTTANPLYTAARAGAPAHRLRARRCSSRSRPFLENARGAAEEAGLDATIVVVGEGDGDETTLPELLAEGDERARGRDRHRDRPRGAPLLERHDRAAEGRDAEPSQPDRQRPAVRRGDPGRGGRRADRRAAVLPHLRADGDHEHGPPLRRDDRDDAALRPRSASSS